MFFDDPLSGTKRVFNELKINDIDEDDDDDLEDYTDDEYDPGDDEDDVDIDAEDDDLEDYTDDEYDPDANDEPVEDDADTDSAPADEETDDAPPADDDTATEEQPAEEAPDENVPAANDDAPAEDTADASTEDAGNDNPPPADEGTNDAPPADNAEDDTGATDDTAGGGDAAEPEIDDLTAGGDVDTENGDPEAGGDDAEGGEGDDAGDGTDDTNAAGDDGTDANTEPEDPNSLKSLEKNLFADLTPAQLAIKDSELLQNYIDLYDAINTILENVNKIPKTYYNTRAIDFIADKMIELKDMVNYTITATYQTKTYIENLTTYKQCLLTLQQVNTMLKGLIQKRTEEENKE